MLLVAFGGALGAVARFGISLFTGKILGTVFPWGTLAANFIGLFIIGFLFEFFDRSVLPPQLRYLLTVGFLGGLTTFSSYGMETLLLFKNGDIRLGIVNMLVSNIGGLILVGAGMAVARYILKSFAWT